MIRKSKTPLLEPGQEILWVKENGEWTMVQGTTPKALPETGRKKKNEIGYRLKGIHGRCTTQLS